METVEDDAAYAARMQPVVDALNATIDEHGPVAHALRMLGVFPSAHIDATTYVPQRYLEANDSGARYRNL
jgi:hypothetical protein